MPSISSPLAPRAAGLLSLVLLAGCGTSSGGGMDSAAMPALADAHRSPGIPNGPVTPEQVQRGRRLALSQGCGDCHSSAPNPAAEGWLTGRGGPEPFDHVGPFRQWPPNLTPDGAALGRYTERQIFNALRFGLRPSATPDVEITSAVPGQGNHPAAPNYLSPAMPWLWWRYMADQQLWDIAAYLKHGVRPVSHPTPPSEGPPDHWASAYTAEKVGGPELPPFPTAHEQLDAPERRAQVLRGRQLVASTACSACHGGAVHPGQAGWLAGAGSAPGSPADSFQIGPFKTFPRNLTPDNATGLGRFSERQIFNALRYGLRPGETPDVEITGTVPGQGNFPEQPKYLAPPMPWPSWRHMPDDDLWAIAAYLKHGVRPVRNRVPDSEGPPDFWASGYTPEQIGTYPPPPFPTAREEYRP